MKKADILNMESVSRRHTGHVVKYKEVGRMYFVKSNNVDNQLLLFTSKKKAKDWLQASTRLTKEEIEKAIIEVKQIIPGMYSIFPTH